MSAAATPRGRPRGSGAGFRGPGGRAARRDPRAPLVVDTRELGRRPGTLRRLMRALPAPEGLQAGLAGVPAGAQLDLELRLEAVREGVLVSGTVGVPLSGECARCLQPVSGRVVAHLQELFAYPDVGADEDAPRLDGDLLDLEPTVRDAVVLALPFTPLCQPECAGMCPQCGVRLATAGEGHGHEQVDHRWAALRTLVADRSEGEPSRPSDQET